MKLGLMQPYFMPYIGYWQRIAAVDRHVIYDDVNYIKNGWMNHNRILINGAEHYLTLTMRGASPNKLINEVEVNNNPIIQGKMLRTLEQAYKRAPYYENAMAVLTPVIQNTEANLAKYLEFQIREICGYLGIETEIIMSSSIEKDNSLRGQDKVIEICKIMNADTYYNASTGEELYNRETFEGEGIKLVFIKDNGGIQYRQLRTGFIPSLSIVDVMMNCSRDELSRLVNDYKTY